MYILAHISYSTLKVVYSLLLLIWFFSLFTLL